jgi:hypothetical protein
MEPVANMSYLVAFLLAWAEAERLQLKKESAQFMSFACMVRTKYVLLAAEDDFERKKWSLQEYSMELADQTSLSASPVPKSSRSSGTTSRHEVSDMTCRRLNNVSRR